MWQPNKLEEERLQKVQEIEARGIEPYPRRVQRTHTAAQAIAAYEKLEPQGIEVAEAQEVTVTGRIRRVNNKGKLSFLHIEDESGRIQLFMRINDMDEAEYNLVKDKLVEMDDFVQATGTLMRTKAGEISVLVHEFKL